MTRPLVPGWVLVGLSALAFGLRLLHVHALRDALLTESTDVGMDRWLAMRMGLAVAQGDWLGGWTADYESAPAYGYWLGALAAVSRGSWLPALVVQSALGAAVVPLVEMVGRRLFSPLVGLVAAVLAAFYGPTIFYETLLVKFALVPVAVALLLLATDVARAAGTARQAFAAGAALGLLVLLRGNAILLLPVVVAWIVGRRPRALSTSRALLAVSLGSALALAPLMIRNAVAARTGHGTSLWGIHFYIASHPGADGTYAPAEGVREDPIGHVVDARRIAEAAAGRALSPTEVSEYWLARGLAFAREEPWRFARLQARKLRLALAGFEEGSFGDDFNDATDGSWVLQLPLVRFGMLCPLALVGVAVTISRRRGELLPAFLGMYAVSLFPFFVTGRYRLPIVVPMQLLAAVGLVWLDDARRRRAYGALAGAAAGMAVVALGLPGEPADRWGCLALVGLGLIALAPISRGTGAAATRLPA